MSSNKVQPHTLRKLTNHKNIKLGSLQNMLFGNNSKVNVLGQTNEYKKTSKVAPTLGGKKSRKRRNKKSKSNKRKRKSKSNKRKRKSKSNKTFRYF